MMDQQSDAIAAYNAQKALYITNALAYDAAYNESRYFDSLIFNGVFSENFHKVIIPKRPCRPSLPNNYTGYFLNLTLQSTADLIASVTSDNFQTMTHDTKGGVMNYTDTKGSGFVKSHHSFGVLGEGNATLPAANVSWSYKNASTINFITRTHTMLVSIFPNQLPFTASATNILDIEVKAYAWSKSGPWPSIVSPPEMPTLADEPLMGGAVQLALSISILALGCLSII